MSYLKDPAVSGPHENGHYEVAVKGDYTWILRDTGSGIAAWRLGAPLDRQLSHKFASFDDAAHAVLGDPATARKWGDR